MKYRPDIDGLRAIAVVSVVLYHLGAPVPGGFLGVDIFFVISGFLICGMIAADIRVGRFSISDFYRRRILRIFPALAVMLVGTALLGYRYLLPTELTELSRTLISAALAFSNIHFAFLAGYFDTPALSKPLLHTWSLGVEEQFYVFAPLFLLSAARYFPRRRKQAFVAFTLASFALQLLVYARNESFAFYFVPCRAWELALGALLALDVFPLPKSIAGRNALGLVGLATILPVLGFGGSTLPLPVISAAACVGAVMVIGASVNGPSIAARLLAWRPLAFIGLISYSLYLWHWPIIVFERSDFVLNADPSSVYSGAEVLLLSFAAAYLSWRFVETPFRRLASSAPMPFVLTGALAAFASIAVLAIFGVMSLGAPGRLSPSVVAIGQYLDYNPAAAFRSGRCYLGGNREAFDQADCLRLDPNKPNYLLVGDSHAAHLWSGLSAALPEVNLMQASASMCRPIAPEPGALAITYCPRLMQLVFNDFLRGNKVDRVILSASWKDEDVPGLSRTLKVLNERGLQAVVLGPIVEYDRPLPRLLADEVRYERPSLASESRDLDIASRDRRLAALAASEGASYISVYDAVCPRGVCLEFAAANIPLQFDTGHLTSEGSAVVGELIANQLRRRDPVQRAEFAASARPLRTASRLER